jgi:hypothetical protein
MVAVLVFSILVDRKKKEERIEAVCVLREKKRRWRDDDDVDIDDSGSVPGLGAIFRSARGVDERRGRPRVVQSGRFVGV